ncbi:MAG: hypothetical protein JSS34_01995 [Proteobacteria bacterium]|nr:hypothetical protein [Pseudomonadota bacterium]
MEEEDIKKEVYSSHLQSAKSSILDPTLKNLNCFQFVAHVLQKDPSKWDAIFVLHEEIQKDLPAEHHYFMPIPYHYSLIAMGLENKTLVSSSLSAVPLGEVRSGDILIYIGLEYNPDVKMMKEPGKGTHVAFIKEVIMNIDQSDISLSLIDASCRRKKRYTDPSNPEKSQLTDSNLGHSTATITASKTHKDLWFYETPGLRKMLKKIFILRFMI